MLGRVWDILAAKIAGEPTWLMQLTAATRLTASEYQSKLNSYLIKLF